MKAKGAKNPHCALAFWDCFVPFLWRHILPLSVALVFEWQSSFQRAPFWFKQRSRTAVLLLLLHQFSTSDQKENYKKNWSLPSWILLIRGKKKLVSSQLNAHGWVFFGTTTKWLFFLFVFQVQHQGSSYIIFLMRREADSEEFSYSLTSPLSRCL